MPIHANWTKKELIKFCAEYTETITELKKRYLEMKEQSEDLQKCLISIHDLFWENREEKEWPMDILVKIKDIVCEQYGKAN